MKTKPPIPRPLPPRRQFLDRSRIKPYPDKRLKLSDLGYGMTVCVASIAGWHTAVMACDKMATYHGGDITAEGAAAKLNNLNRHWHVLMAGDLGRASLVIDPCRSYFTENGWDRKWTSEEVGNTVKMEYQARLRTEVTDTVLAQYGLDMETFIRDGLVRFGSEGFADIKYKIEQATREFDLELMLVGFDSAISPAILVISNPGVISDRTNPGFWAIGSGASMAINSLALKRQDHFEDISKTIFNVLEAKFQAERSIGVGRDTWLNLESPYYQFPFFHDDLLKQIRQQWELEHRRRTRLPRKVAKLLAEYDAAPKEQLKSSSASSSGQ